ncbi:hypothetical protein KY284_005603 [Solanum tuberosum]|nr:hypothetical protein KY284_005603 [Solanum tuberosum]
MAKGTKAIGEPTSGTPTLEQFLGRLEGIKPHRNKSKVLPGMAIKKKEYKGRKREKGVLTVTILTTRIALWSRFKNGGLAI